MIRSLLALLVAACIATPAAAQAQRNFPQNALRGALTVGDAGILVNGRPAVLAPGARIRDMNNMSIVTGGVAGGRFLVNYTIDTSGLVKDVWILRPEEAARRPWPTSPEEAERWTFDADAQVWIKP